VREGGAVGALERVRVLLLAKEWPEQRRWLLLGLVLLLLLWATALAGALLGRPGGEAAAGWLSRWAQWGFPVAALCGLVPLQALLAGVMALAPGRQQGSREFLFARPVRGREVWAAKAAAALGASCLFAGAFWLTEALLWFLARSPGGPVPFPMRGLRAAAFTTLVAVLPSLAAGLAGGALGRTIGRAAALGLGLLALAHAVALLPALALSEFGWWVPPWGVGALAGGAALAVLSLAWTEEASGERFSRSLAAAGAGLAVLLAAGAGVWGDRLSLSPSEAGTIRIFGDFPEQPTLLLQPEGSSRTWRWDAPAPGRRAPIRALPGLATAPVGPAGDAVLLYLRQREWSRSRVLAASLPDGRTRRLLDLPASEARPLEGDLITDLLGRTLFLDAATGTLWSPADGLLLATLPGVRRFIGWWGEEVLLEGDEGLVTAVSLDPPGVRELPPRQGVLPLRSGRFLSFLRDGALRLWDESQGEETLLAERSACGAGWAHHLETLYFCRDATLTAWHHDVGERALLEGVDRFRILPGGTRLLVRVEGQAAVLHAGTRALVYLAVPKGADAAQLLRAAPSPDGRWLALAAGAKLHLIDLSTGIAAPKGPAASDGAWVSWDRFGEGEARAASAGAPGTEPGVWVRVDELALTRETVNGSRVGYDMKTGRAGEETP